MDGFTSKTRLELCFSRTPKTINSCPRSGHTRRLLSDTFQIKYSSQQLLTSASSFGESSRHGRSPLELDMTARVRPYPLPMPVVSCSPRGGSRDCPEDYDPPGSSNRSNKTRCVSASTEPGKRRKRQRGHHPWAQRWRQPRRPRATAGRQGSAR